FREDLEQIRAIASDGRDRAGLADRGREDRVDESLAQLALRDPAEIAAGARGGALRVVASERGEIRALVRLVLEGLEVVDVSRSVHDLDHVPAERGLDGRQDVARLEAGFGDGGQERRVDRRHRLVEVRELAPGARRSES